ncbi:MAG: M20 metallopeptidase family protein [Eubacteriaceae bacterium]
MGIEISSYLDEAKKLRRDLHEIPEEGFNLYKTQNYIFEYLSHLGYSPLKILNTGVLLYIEGKNKNTIAFRADMDALSIEEKNTFDFASKHHGFMHACGHDGHITMNLLLAKYLKEIGEKPNRNVLLIFQPGEEGPGGAEPIIKSGILDQYDIKAVIGYHLFPFIPEGVISTVPGPMMGQNSEFYYTIQGKSGHAAEPQMGIDAIYSSAMLINNFQSIISKNVDPGESAVIAIGEIHGGVRVNVIADEVKIGGTMRSFNDHTHQLLKEKMSKIAKGIELSTDCIIKEEFIDMYPSVINDKALYSIFKELIGDLPFLEFNKVMLSEDFSYYQKKYEGLFIGIGTKNEEKGLDNNLHTSLFNFDESVLLTGLDISIRFINYNKFY